nr:reverse transcriptase domain-containing protein [Tanacetum cinerariifolium]
LLRLYVGNKMNKAFPLLGESSHWQYKFPLPVEGVPTARKMKISLPRVCTAMMKKLPVKENWQTRVNPSLLNNFEEINMATNRNGDDGPPAGGGDLPVLDLRTMEELCQPTLNGRGGSIAPIAIQATNFGIKNDMIHQVQNSCQFHGLSGDDANKHLDKFCTSPKVSK